MSHSRVVCLVGLAAVTLMQGAPAGAQGIQDVYHACFGGLASPYNSVCYPQQPITQPVVDVQPGMYGTPTVYVTADGYIRSWIPSSSLGSNPIGPIRVQSGLSSSTDHIVAVMEDGTFRGIPITSSGNYYGQCNAPPDLGTIERASAGRFHTVVLTSGGEIRCFGMTNFGQCSGPAGGGFVDVGAGGLHSGAVRQDGTVACWGSNYYGESNPPADVTDVVQIRMGYHTCLALRADGTVRSWGHPVLAPPAGLPALVEIDANVGDAAMGRTADGSVICWGSNADALNGVTTPPGMKPKPSSLPPAVKIAAGAGTVGIITAQNEMILWGADSLNQASPPQPLDSISDGVGRTGAAAWISARGQAACSTGYFGSRANLEEKRVRSIDLGWGSTHSAILADGRLYVWSNLPELHERVPAAAYYARSAAASTSTVAAIDLGGNLRTWGSFQSATVVAPPTAVGPYRRVECGYDFCIALSESGTLHFWGAVPSGMAAVPSGLSDPSDFAISSTYGYPHDAVWVIDSKGRLVAWNSVGEVPVPANLPPLASIDGDQSVVVARAQSGDWWWWYAGSTSATPLGAVLKAKPGGMQFWCQSTPPYNSGTIVLPALGFGVPVAKDFIGLRRAASDVSLQIGAIADLNLQTEFATVRLNGAPLATIFVAGGNDCPTTPDTVSLTIPMAQFNQALAAGSVTIQIDASIGVSGSQCPLGRTTLQLAYSAEMLDCNGNSVNDACEIAGGSASDCDRNGVPDDCDLLKGAIVDFDGNGVLDTCEPDCDADGIPDGLAISTGSARDCNGNLTIDSCEIALGGQDKDADGRLDECEIAAGDFDLTGFVDGADLGALLGLWGFASPPYGDLDRDGIVGGGDLAMLLGAWGPLR